MLHRGLFIYSEKKMRFSSYNFCLKRRLGEPTQFKIRLQFERARQPIRINSGLSFPPKEQGVMEKLVRIAMGVFGAWHSHVWVMRCYGSKISKGGFINVTIGLTEPIRIGDTIGCLSNGRRGGRVYHVIRMSSRCLQGYTQHNWGVKGITL
jgi:hypothetical protein